MVLYQGQGKFHSSTYKTLDYVVGQANFTVDNLRNFSETLAEAKKVKVDQVFLPTNVQGEIDALEAKVNSSANNLASQTSDNSRKISRVLDSVYDYCFLYLNCKFHIVELVVGKDYIF